MARTEETLFSSHFGSHCTRSSHRTVRARRQLLKVAVGGHDLAVAVMVVPCLSAGERVQLLADRGERDIVGEESRELAGPQLLVAQPAGQVVIAVRLIVL